MKEKEQWSIYLVYPDQDWLLKYILDFDSKEKAREFGKNHLQPNGHSYYISNCPELDGTSLTDVYVNEGEL